MRNLLTHVAKSCRQIIADANVAASAFTRASPHGDAV